MEEKIIEFIKKNEMFYNKKNPYYKRTDLKNMKLMELSKQLNVPVKTLSSRWRSLRDNYYRELKNRGPKKKWKWMDQMMFISNANRVNENTSRNTLKAEEVSSDDEFISNLYLRFAEGGEEISSTLVSENVTTPALEEVVPTDADESRICGEEMNVPTSKRKPVKINDCHKKMLLKAKHEISDLITFQKEPSVEPEAVQPHKKLAEIFFKSLEIQTKEANLSPEKFSELQIELLKCFHKFMYEK